MKTFSKLSLIILSALFLTSCDWNQQTAVGSGDVETMEVSVSEFTGVSITGTCNVEILIGETQQLELSAQQQILDVMTYEVRNGILTIGFRPDVNIRTEKEISAQIVVRALDYAGITGAGDFKISGDPQPALDVYITGAGNVEALDMEVEDCSIRIDGSGNCEVNVSKHLDVRISGVGNVFYRGTPNLSSEISGVGNLFPLDH